MNRFSYILSLLLITLTLSTTVDTQAFPLDTYAEKSVLSSGRWVKISVSSTGIHLITTEDLRRWGFSDPSRVRVYGYGGGRLSDVLSKENYTDDLPLLQSVLTPRGIFFYANGPESWRTETSGNKTLSERVLNPYSTRGYYYLSDIDAEERAIPVEGTSDSGDSPATTFSASVHHEQELVSIIQSGHTLYGEDFRFTPSRNFSFNLTDRVEGTDVSSLIRFFCNSPASPTRLTLTANGATLPSNNSDVIAATASDDGYAYGDSCVSIHSFPLDGTRLTLGITHSASGSIKNAYLDKIDITYTRHIKLNNGVLDFSSQNPGVRLSGAWEGTYVWDVTDPLDIKEMNAGRWDDGIEWRNDYSGTRHYAAWGAEAKFPSPVFVGVVPNQNLHALEAADMVIFTPAAFRAQAQRIAELHTSSQEAFKVHVIDAEEVYNEFGSGIADVNALRRCLKMLYDRGEQAGVPLRFCLLMGRVVSDHRRITQAWANSTSKSLPVWQTDTSINVNNSYSSDDILAMLDDDSGAQKGRDILRIAIGRVPASNETDARIYADKLTNHINASPEGEWRCNAMFVADDQDSGTHMDQTEAMIDNLRATDPSGLFVNKVYIDAFKMVGREMPQAREKMFRHLSEGTMWWNYVGHGSITTLSHEFQLVKEDINSLYLKRLPIFYAATCSFAHWDSTEPSGAEMLVMKENGGAIVAIAPTRPVYISANGTLTKSLGNTMLQRGADGNLKTVGEIIRDAKNYIYNAPDTSPSNDENKLRYVYIGDPALPLSLPSARVVLESINGHKVDLEQQITLRAHENAILEGYLTDGAGKMIDDFSGLLHVSLYDAELTSTTTGRSTPKNPGKILNFEEQGSRLYSGRDSVRDGRFRITIPMPADISQNFRQAALSMYAVSDKNVRAAGLNRDFYVYGYDEDALPDDIPPTIEWAYLNHESFKNGDVVNESPMLLAHVSDNVGINMSAAGIGHQMNVLLDGNRNYNDVALYYTPSADGSSSGTIAYPVENLAPGNHRLSLRVWDTSNNSTTADIDFFVEKGQTPKIFDVYTDTNPASVEANFYVSHNRPDASLKVTIAVYNLAGRLEWSETKTGPSDMFVSSPVTWNLCDGAGHRVPRGIYVYRATVSTPDGTTESSMSKRIAVTGE